MSQPVQLPGFLAALAPLLDHWGYLAVGFLIFIEDFGVPSPGETVLIAASVYAGAGRLNIVAVGVIGFAAAVLGDNLGYAIGRLGGRTLVLRFGRYVLLTPERLDRAESFFTRHGGKIITVARFIEGLRQANGIIAGLTRMPWARFLAFNALGAALWGGHLDRGRLPGRKPHPGHLHPGQPVRPLPAGRRRAGHRGADHPAPATARPPPHVRAAKATPRLMPRTPETIIYALTVAIPGQITCDRHTNGPE